MMKRLLCVLALSIASLSAFAAPVISISLMSPTGKLEVSHRAEFVNGQAAFSSLSQGSKAGSKFGDAAGWRLERPGAVVVLNQNSADLSGMVMRVVQDSDGTPTLIPMQVKMPFPSKGSNSSVNLPDGSILTVGGL